MRQGSWFRDPHVEDLPKLPNRSLQSHSLQVDQLSVRCKAYGVGSDGVKCIGWQKIQPHRGMSQSFVIVGDSCESKSNGSPCQQHAIPVSERGDRATHESTQQHRVGCAICASGSAPQDVLCLRDTSHATTDSSFCCDCSRKPRSSQNTSLLKL